MEDHHDHESHADVPHGTNKGSPQNPCLKSSGSSSNNNNNNNTNNSNSNTNTTINKEQDRFLPIANVGRIMKKVIPSNGKISKDAKETVQECVSEFISFVTGEASDKCQREKRKTINGDDIIWAITTLGFEEYVGPLKLYLSKYREIEGEKLNIPKQQRLSEQQKQQQQQQQHQQHQSDHHHDQKQNMLPYNSSVYSSTSMLSFVPSSDHQPFSLPFSSNSIQKQLQQQQDHQIDSVGHW